MAENVEQLGKELGKQMTKFNEELKNIGETHSETEKAIDALKDQLEVMTDGQSKSQEQLDQLDAKLQKIGISKDKMKSFGDHIETMVKSEDYQAKVKSRSPFVMDLSDLFISKAAATITDATHFTNDVQGAMRLPGVFYSPHEATHVRQLLTVGQTSSNAITYNQETATTDGAAAIAEAGSYPQSDYKLTLQTSNVKKIGAYLKIGEESLTDAAFMRSYLSQRLVIDLLGLEDSQILNGSGSGANLSGINTNATAYVDSIADSNVNRYDVLAYAITQARVSNYRASAIVLHPRDLLKLKLSKSTTGEYVFSSDLRVAGQIRVEGVPILDTTAQTETEFTVGDFRNGCTLFERKGVEVSFWEQDGTNVQSDLVTVKVRERLALPIYHTGAFVYGDFASALAQGTA